jgi:5-methylcytosine-specific restriction endonuclease McrA
MGKRGPQQAVVKEQILQVIGQQGLYNSNYKTISKALKVSEKTIRERIKYKFVKLSNDYPLNECLYCKGKHESYPTKAKGFCSKGCRYKAKLNRGRNREPVIKDCLTCGVEIRGHIDKKYCSSECRKAINNDQKELTQLQQRLDKAIKRIEKIEKKIKTCSECNEYYYGGVKYCSNRCNARAVYIPYKPKWEDCKRCKGMYWQDKPRTIYCNECRERAIEEKRFASRSRRRLRILNTRVGKISLKGLRDKYKCCNLCGVDTVRTGDTNKDNYENIDHVIPLAQGGTHTQDNLQILCRQCNMDKLDVIYKKEMYLVVPDVYLNNNWGK